MKSEVPASSSGGIAASCPGAKAGRALARLAGAVRPSMGLEVLPPARFEPPQLMLSAAKQPGNGIAGSKWNLTQYKTNNVKILTLVDTLK